MLGKLTIKSLRNRDVERETWMYEDDFEKAVIKGNYTKYMQDMLERNVWKCVFKKTNAPIELKAPRSRNENIYYI
jgi:hypothetical protein